MSNAKPDMSTLLRQRRCSPYSRRPEYAKIKTQKSESGHIMPFTLKHSNKAEMIEILSTWEQSFQQKTKDRTKKVKM